MYERRCYLLKKGVEFGPVWLYYTLPGDFKDPSFVHGVRLPEEFLMSPVVHTGSCKVTMSFRQRH